MRVLLYANTRFRGQPHLAPWETSLDIFELLARNEWSVSSGQIHRLQNRSARDFLAWLEGFRISEPSDETLLLYFATHQLRDGTILFAEGPSVGGAAFVEAVNVLGENRRVILINDSCYAEKLESCGTFSPRVIRLYACGPTERASEVKLRNGSPAGMRLFRAERAYLDRQFDRRVNRASFLGLLWLRASRDSVAQGHETITWRTLYEQVMAVRDDFDKNVMQPRVQHPAFYPSDVNFELLRRVTQNETSVVPHP